MKYLYIYRNNRGSYSASFTRPVEGGNTQILQSDAIPDKAVAILDALTNGAKLPSMTSVLVDLEYKKLHPKTKLQHRKIFRDDNIESDHSYWHDIAGGDCGRSEAEAKKAISQGGVVDKGYCLDMFREVAA